MARIEKLENENMEQHTAIERLEDEKRNLVTGKLRITEQHEAEKHQILTRHETVKGHLVNQKQQLEAQLIELRMQLERSNEPLEEKERLLAHAQQKVQSNVKPVRYEKVSKPDK